jgi:PST family polysaccharide transporter
MRAQLVKGTAWISATRVLTNLMAFLSTLVLARILSPADFGLVALATSMLTVLSAVTDARLGLALIQHRTPTIEHYHAAWTLGFLRSAVLAPAFCIAAFPAAKIFHEPRLTGVMFALAGGLLVAGLTNPRSTTLVKRLVFWQQFLLQVSQKLVTLIVSVTVAFLFHSYWALVWGTLAGQAVGVALSFVVAPFRPRFSLRHCGELFGFSIWLTLTQVINTLSWNFDQLLIGGMLGRAALGHYTVSDNLAATPTREATAPITNTLFPAFSQLVREPKRLAAAYQSAQALVTSIALPAGVGMALIADPFVRLALGVKWLPAVFQIQVLASIFALQTLGTLSAPLAMANGGTQLVFRRDLQSFILRLPFVAVGLLWAGVTGIIWARAITGPLTIILHMQVVKRVTGLSLLQQIRANERSLLSAALMAAVVLLVRPHHGNGEIGPFGLAVEIAIRVLVGAATYIGVHLVAWLAMGKPKGPEVEVAKMVDVLARRLRLTPSVAH